MIPSVRENHDMRPSRSISALGIATLALILLSVNGQRAATPPGPYIVTDLGTLGTVQSAQAYDINDAGQTVGYAGNHAFVWQNSVLTDLGTLGGNASIARAINTFGQIAGQATLASSSLSHAVLWDNGAKIDLTPGSASSSTANGINDSRQIVLNTSNNTAFLWQNGVLTDLGSLGGGGSFVQDINNAGQAVGSSAARAFLWQNGVMTDLGVLPGGGDDESGAAAINSIGQIVGSSGHTNLDTYEITSRSFLYDHGVMTALPVASSESYAGDINDSGVIVGTMRAGGGVSPWHAYIYADGVVTDLNSLIPPGSDLHLLNATAINNAGQIVGVAFDSRASYHAFLLNKGTAPAVPPTAPSGLIVTGASADRCTLVWTDNANNEIGSKIERSRDGATFTQVATVGPNLTSYVDAGLARSTTYYYRLRAYNNAGNSPYSNIASVRTKNK